MRQLKSDRLSTVLRPSRVAVIGASSQRHTLGNQVLQNFTHEGFGGSIVAVNKRVECLEGWPTVPTIEDLPPDLDVVMVCIPAASLPDVLQRLDATGCPAAVVPTAGFSAAQYEALEEACKSIEMTVTGPNCLGILSLADSAPLWTAGYRTTVPRGGVSIVAQSGSAAISIMSSPGLGFARIISSGNEIEVTSAHYLRWLVDDPETSCIGLIVESIRSPDEFADSVAAARHAGKQVVALKVGRSPVGSLAAQAHTSALVSNYDAYVAFFARHGVPTVLDYDEMVATLQCMSNKKLPRARGSRVGVVGISGGQTALACDLAAETGVVLAEFSPNTVSRVETALPDAPGQNPIDIGATVGEERRKPDEALRAVLEDPGTDSVLVIQDAQNMLPLDPTHTYIGHVKTIEAVSRSADKPIVIASSSSGDIHPMLEQLVEGAATPIVRGLRPALVALRNLGVRAVPEDAVPVHPRRDRSAELRASVSEQVGPLPYLLVRSLLDAYEIPFVRSRLVKEPAEVMAAAHSVGYPLVVKVASTDIPHRLEIGAVVVGIGDATALEAALEQIAANLARNAPHARIDGYELQEWIPDTIESILGFAATPPFGPMMVVGTGGSFVELARDRATDLAPVSIGRAVDLVRATALGAILEGYRGKVAATSLHGLAETMHKFSLLAADFRPLLRAGELNPALVEPVTGRVVVVDALLVSNDPGGARPRDAAEPRHARCEGTA